MKRLVLALAVVMVAVSAQSCDKAPTTPRVAEVSGKLFGIVHIPRAEWPVEVRPEVLGELGEHKLPIGSTWISLSADSSMYEVRRSYPTDSLSVTVGSRIATISADGEFRAMDVPVGLQEVVFSLGGKVVHKQTVEIREGSGPLELKIERVVATCCPKVAQPNAGDAVGETFRCLDDNGVGPAGFVFSDCYVSLFYGPPWYSWMCWQEAMDRVHDHHGNIWCDGSHNCSLFVHGWDWNKQRWHKHSWPWVPRW